MLLYSQPQQSKHEAAEAGSRAVKGENMLLMSSQPHRRNEAAETRDAAGVSEDSYISPVLFVFHSFVDLNSSLMSNLRLH